MYKKIFLFFLLGLSVTTYSFIQKINTINPSMAKSSLAKQDLIKHVQLAINPIYKNWICFKNGTYIIFENESKKEDIKKEGFAKMKKFGPVYAGGAGGDFGVISLTMTEGWVVSGYGYGIYTYVHPSELEIENPQDYEIGLLGRSKRDLDGINPEIICISSQGKIISE